VLSLLPDFKINSFLMVDTSDCWFRGAKVTCEDCGGHCDEELKDAREKQIEMEALVGQEMADLRAVQKEVAGFRSRDLLAALVRSRREGVTQLGRRGLVNALDRSIRRRN
jgi:hypothetical protein